MSSAFWQALLAQRKPLVLTQEFLHDSRRDALRFGPGWDLIGVGSGDPYRNADVTVNFNAKAAGVQLALRCTSQGKPDEYLSLHAVLDPDVLAQVYLNGKLVAEYYAGNAYAALDPCVQYLDRGTFWQHNDFFASPFIRLQPVKGVNLVKLVVLPSSSGSNNVFFDGAGRLTRGQFLPA